MGADRRQGRIGKGGARNVVVPDDGEISGNGKPGFTDRHHRPNGQGVVAREQGRRSYLGSEDHLHRLITTLPAKVSFREKLFVEANSGLLQSEPIPLVAAPRRVVDERS